MKNLLRFLACWAAFGASLLLGSSLIGLLHLRTNFPADIDTGTMYILTVFAGWLLVLGLWPLARGLAGPTAARATVMGVFMFLALGVNTILDGLIYTTLWNGAIPANVLTYGLQAALVGCALGFWFGNAGRPDGFPSRGWFAWAGRGTIAWLAWPVIYFFFGACIAPIVVPYYSNGSIPWLHMPPMSTIVAMQLVRSAIFMAASLPVIALWKGSRRSLWFALGLAHAVTVGIFGLVATTLLPGVLRITHGVEITCDSLAYAGLLVLLFSAPAESKAAVKATRHDAAFHAL